MLIRQNGSVPVLSAATATGAGAWIKCYGLAQTYQVIANGTSGAYSATVKIEVTNDITSGTPAATALGTIAVSGTATTAASDGFATGTAPWAWVRANVTVISGTGANVSVWMGC